jgi:hypothetical protein
MSKTTSHFLLLNHSSELRSAYEFSLRTWTGTSVCQWWRHLLTLHTNIHVSLRTNLWGFCELDKPDWQHRRHGNLLREPVGNTIPVYLWSLWNIFHDSHSLLELHTDLHQVADVGAIKDTCKYIESSIVDSRQGMVLQLGVWRGAVNS